MRKYIILLAVVLTGVVAVNAQNKEELPPAEDRAQMQTEFMTEKLELSEEQVPQVLTINLAAAKKMDEVMSLTDKMKKFKAFRSAMMEKDEALKEVLSKDQFKLYKKSKDEMKKKIKEKRKENKN
jgi:predicted acylesterase/phospholipase RssA